MSGIPYQADMCRDKVAYGEQNIVTTLGNLCNHHKNLSNPVSLANPTRFYCQIHNPYYKT